MASYVYQINKSKILAERAKRTYSGTNIDEALANKQDLLTPMDDSEVNAVIEVLRETP